jgi:hypothetical protein
MYLCPKVMHFQVFILLVAHGWPVKTYQDFRYELQTFLVDGKAEYL